MTLSRRSLVMQVAATAIMAPTMQAFAQSMSPRSASRIRAIAFDAFPIFDPRPIVAACERLFPGRGGELSNAWRTRQFEYQWLRALGGRYADFWDATRDALVFAAASMKLELADRNRDELMQGYLELKAWPDVKPVLDQLRTAGIKLAFLSNATPAILNAGIRNSELQGAFDEVISTDKIRSFKPDPRAYKLGVDVLKFKKEEILFVAFAGWDVAGAKWFGYPTFWNNRQSSPVEQLSATPDASGPTLNELVGYLRA